VIVATHDWETVQKMQRRIVAMERGKIMSDTKTPCWTRRYDQIQQEPSSR